MSKEMCADKNVPFGDDEKILKAFLDDGYVVVANVLTDKETKTALDELWESPRLLGLPGIDRNKSSTWWGENWPQSNGGRNFLDSGDAFRDAATFDLPFHPRVVHLQKLLYQRSDLMCDGLGRWGVMRPCAEHPGSRTEQSWLHWDQNPWSEAGFVRLQAILCLTDNTETSGGFACVPGFHKEFRAWGEKHPLGTVVSRSGRKADLTFGVNQPFLLPAEDPRQRRVVRVLAPAGSMVLWDSRLPHQNFPNTDKSEFRVVFYCMMKVKDQQSAKEHRDLLLKKKTVLEILGRDQGEQQRFPHSLSAVAKEMNCLDAFGADLPEFVVPDGLGKAVPLVVQAGQAEERGDIAGAIRNHQTALRLCPDIEPWYGAIFGS